MEIAIAKNKAKGMSEADAVKAAIGSSKKSDGLTDMKITKKEVKGKSAPCCGLDSSSSRYPYGLEIRLDDEVMKKLGIDLPEVGKEISIVAKATATEASSRDSQDGGKRLSCTLQITKLKVG